MIEGKTKSGFQYKLDNNRLKNYELVEVLGDLDSSPLLLPKAVKMILGEEQTANLKDHLRAKDGTVPTDKMEAEIIEIFQNQTVKNSQSSPK